MTISLTNKDETIGVRFISAGIAACVADFMTFPLDTAKVRLQIQGENLLQKNRTTLNSIDVKQLSNPYVISQNLKGATSNNILPLSMQSIKWKPIHINNSINPEKSYLHNIKNSIHYTNSISPTIENIRPHYKGLIGTISTIIRNEGYLALYNGLFAGLQRQLSFASIRIGLYENVRNYYENFIPNSSNKMISKINTPSPSLQADSINTGRDIGIRIMAGITTGGVAVLVAQPADVVKVRLQAQISNAATKSTFSIIGSSSSRYSGAMDAYKKIYVCEGIKGLWKGLLPNMTRNAVINASELVGYDLFKRYLLARTKLTDNFPCHFFAAFGAGFVTTLIASPVDVVKTRFMNSTPKTYKGALHCAYVMLSSEGPKSFYKGFTPSFMRLASWNIVMFVCYEQFKRQIISIKSSLGQPRNSN